MRLVPGLIARRIVWPHLRRTCLFSEPRASRCPAIVADRQQPVLDGEPDAFLDQSPCDAGNAGTVGALLHEFFQVADRCESQGYGNAVSFGFFSGHRKTLFLLSLIHISEPT